MKTDDQILFHDYLRSKKNACGKSYIFQIGCFI